MSQKTSQSQRDWTFKKDTAENRPISVLIQPLFNIHDNPLFDELKLLCLSTILFANNQAESLNGSLNGCFGNKSVELDFEKKVASAHVGKGDRQR